MEDAIELIRYRQKETALRLLPKRCKNKGGGWGGGEI